jgi:hypothetical protein
MDFFRGMRHSKSYRLVVISIAVFLTLIIFVFNDQTIGAIPAIRVIKDFFAVDIDRILFLFIPILIVLLILGIIESKRINKLKT